MTRHWCTRSSRCLLSALMVAHRSQGRTPRGLTGRRPRTGAPTTSGSIGCAGVHRRLPRRPVGHQLLRRRHRARARECVVVDPGKDAADGVAEVVREHRLKPVAVLVTHGHIDHMWCVAPVAGTYDATAWIHPADRHLLTDPMAGMSPETAADAARRRLRVRRARRRARADRRPGRSSSPGCEFVVDHTPGHTEGSVTFRTPYGEQDVSEVMFSGDLLFAGSIGRTDLPGGDHPTMLRSLRDKVLPLRRRHRGAARSRRADLDRPRARHQPLPAGPAADPRTVADEQADPAERVPRAPARPALRRAAGHRHACARTFELHGFAAIETRAVEPLDQLLRKGETSKEVYVLRRLQADADAERRRRARPALRPDRAVRALRARERRQAGVPVPPLPDPEGLARRAAAGGPLPRVHPGRHRHRRRATSCRSTTTSRSRG